MGLMVIMKEMLLAAKTRRQQSHQVNAASDYCNGGVIVAYATRSTVQEAQSVRQSFCLLAVHAKKVKPEIKAQLWYAPALVDGLAPNTGLGRCASR